MIWLNTFIYIVIMRCVNVVLLGADSVIVFVNGVLDFSDLCA